MCIEELKNNLEKIAFQKSTPYCCLCQADAPSGVCESCHSDDLMKRTDNGVDWGTDWVISDLVEEHLSPIDGEEYFEASMKDCYSDEVKIGWLTLNPIDVIKTYDPTSWQIALNEYIDNLEEDGRVVTLGTASRYYWTDGVRKFIDENLEAAAGAS